jgi:hypothetical protein
MSWEVGLSTNVVITAVTVPSPSHRTARSSIAINRFGGHDVVLDVLFFNRALASRDSKLLY